MAGQDVLVLLAVFNDITAADHAVDGYWDWSERITGNGPEAIGVLVNLERGLDAQLIGDESGFGTETGPALDVFEALLESRRPGDEEEGMGAEQLISALSLDRNALSALRQELNLGRAILLLTLSEGELEAAKEQLEALGGRTTLHTLPRASLLQAAAALAGDDLDDDFFFDEDEDEEYVVEEFEAFEEDEYAFDDYDDDDSYTDNGRY